MKERSGQAKSSHGTGHKETKPTSRKRDWKHVEDMTNHVLQNMTDPFDTETHPDILINIATGVHATPTIQQSLLSARSNGERQMNNFVKMALSTDQHGSFYSPITKSGVQTFSDMAKKSKFQSGQVKITGSLSPEVIFRRALSIARCRDDVSLESVLSHPVGPVPSAIFHEDGAMRKSTKAQLGLKLEETVPKVTMLPQHPQATSVYIRDGMNVIQMLPGDNFSSFENLAKAYQEHLLTGFSKANTVVDVFDRYDNESRRENIAQKQDPEAGNTV